MYGEGNGLAAAEVSLTAAPVERRVTIQHLLPETLSWHANTIVLSDYRRKITNEEQLVGRISATSQKADDAALNILAVHPGETTAIEVQFVQRALTAIQSIQVPHPALQRRVKRRGQQIPIEACIMVPLRPLAELR